MSRARGRPAVEGLVDWISFFDAIDEARRTRTFAALKRLYYRSRRTKEQALLNAATRALAQELKLPTPWWASHSKFLQEPYFVSGVENLKATALLESPMAFRQNNIFVLSNFLNRV